MGKFVGVFFVSFILSFSLLACFGEAHAPKEKPINHKIHDDGVSRYYIERETYYLMDRKREVCSFVSPYSSHNIPWRSCYLMLISTAAEAFSE